MKKNDALFNENISQFKYFFSYYFLFILLRVFFQETYNTWLHKRYRDNSSTHPKLNLNLWSDVESTSRYINQVYSISNTMNKDIQVGWSVLIL